MAKTALLLSRHGNQGIYTVFAAQRRFDFDEWECGTEMICVERNNHKQYESDLLGAQMSRQGEQLNNFSLKNEAITAMAIRPLDNHAYCVQSAFAYLGLWGQLHNCSWHNFRARQCLIKSVLLTFSSGYDRLLQFQRGTFRPPVLVIRWTWGQEQAYSIPAHGLLLSPH